MPCTSFISLQLSQAKRRVFLVQRGKASSTGKAGSKRALAAAEEDAGSAAKARELLRMRRVNVNSGHQRIIFVSVCSAR
jgi:hypothetical protein